MKSLLEQNGGFFIEFEMLSEMKAALQQLFASGAVVIIATMAKSCGSLLSRKIKSQSQNPSANETIEKFCEILSEWNWGEFSFSQVDLEQGSGKAFVKNSIETRRKKSKDGLGCYFLSNFIAGFLSELLCRDVTVKERKCVCRMNGICEFEFYSE